jgi:hypothetical protein
VNAVSDGNGFADIMSASLLYIFAAQGIAVIVTGHCCYLLFILQLMT